MFLEIARPTEGYSSSFFKVLTYRLCKKTLSYTFASLHSRIWASFVESQRLFLKLGCFNLIYHSITISFPFPKHPFIFFFKTILSVSFFWFMFLVKSWSKKEKKITHLVWYFCEKNERIEALISFQYLHIQEIWDGENSWDLDQHRLGTELPTNG